MKKVKKDFTQVPASLTSQRCHSLTGDAMREKGIHNFRKDVYRSPEVQLELDRIYNKKCAFCESDTTAGAPLQVEHYRPKAKVTEDISHPGYYWLGYEWSNLMLACAICNRTKWNHFDLEAGAKHQPRPPMRSGSLDKKRCLITTRRLVAEKAQILNPEVENDVRQHFIYDDAGQISGATTHGTNTIIRTGLDRRPLNVARKKVLDRCELMILKAIARFDNGINSRQQTSGAIEAALEQLLSTYLLNEPYSEYAFHCWHHVPTYLIQPLRPEFQAVANAAYQRIQHALGAPLV